MGRRAGAVTVALDSWHLDFPQFLEMQTESGDPRFKAYDVFPQVVHTDYFMRHVEKNLDWFLICPYEIKQFYGVEIEKLWGNAFYSFYGRLIADIQSGKYTGRYEIVNARELYKKIMETQVETGLPYTVFKDTINRANPNKHDGMIPCFNLCTESNSNVEAEKYSHTCNLNSLNMANIDDYDQLHKICRIAVRALDNTIELTNSPFQESANHNRDYRTIGVGVMGVADWAAGQGIKYSDVSIATRKKFETLFANIAYSCTYASVELAKERGSYPKIKGSSWDRELLFGSKHISELVERNIFTQKQLEFLQSEIKKYGIRNSHIVAIAPNTSSSLVQGCSASILPVFSKFFQDKWSNGTIPVMPAFIEDRLWYYEENKTLDQNHIVEIVSDAQRWIDTGISMETIFNLNENVYTDASGNPKTLTPKDIYDVQMKAYFRGCKAIYYTRTIQKDEIGSSSIETCSSCAN